MTEPLVVRVTGQVVVRESDGQTLALVEVHHGDRVLSQQVVEATDRDRKTERDD